jgi:hypothetical protein
MATKTEVNYVGDIVISEAADHYSRTAVTIASGADLVAGAVLGATTTAATVAASPDAGNTGNGAITLGDPAFSGAALPGVYVATCVEPGSNVGTFQVQDPTGAVIGRAVVAVEFDGPVVFTIADGATDFVAGDIFRITVSAVTRKYKSSAPTATDGSQIPVAVLLTPATAASADVADAVALARHARVNRSSLVFNAAIDNAAKRRAATDALALQGITIDAQY